MRKLFVISLCIAALGLGLSLASCQKKEMANEEPKQTEQKAVESGEQQPAETGGYGEQKPAESGEATQAPAGGYGK